MRFYVNIDHVATVRQARRTDEPDPVRAAVLVELGGADGITVHLRADTGHTYYYAHLDSRAFSGSTRVNQGDVIGYNGNSGNARTTSPHLH